jgi:hypothetical protein
MGLLIFHSARGGVPMLGMSPYNRRNIGFYLGEVVEVNGPNRIYYLDVDGTKKYVSLKGVGLVCTTPKEVAQIDEIRTKAHTAFKSAVADIANQLESSLDNLLES